MTRQSTVTNKVYHGLVTPVYHNGYWWVRIKNGKLNQDHGIWCRVHRSDMPTNAEDFIVDKVWVFRSYDKHCVGGFRYYHKDTLKKRSTWRKSYENVNMATLDSGDET